VPDVFPHGQAVSNESKGRVKMRKAHASGAKQAAEKGVFPGEKCEEHPAEAKARHLFPMTYGTTEVVP
jgi:hypothetical protein